MLLNITNGDYLNAKLSKENEGEFFPFREATIQGNLTQAILSEDFIKARAESLSVTVDYYKKNAQNVLDFIQNHARYSKLKLWFGDDTFCQLNLLTLLALLEQINYSGEIEIVIVDDETGSVVASTHGVKLGQYYNLYKKILLNGQMPDETGAISKRAIELYFDYLSPNGHLANLARQNADLEQSELVVLLLKNSKEYGLSDLNVKELLKREKIVKI